MFKVGDYVLIRPEWCDSVGQTTHPYKVVSVNEVTRRCIIQSQMCELALVPTEVVSFEMIYKF